MKSLLDQCILELHHRLDHALCDANARGNPKFPVVDEILRDFHFPVFSGCPQLVGRWCGVHAGEAGIGSKVNLAIGDELIYSAASVKQLSPAFMSIIVYSKALASDSIFKNDAGPGRRETSPPSSLAKLDFWPG
jgi:hypothetical protein